MEADLMTNTNFYFLNQNFEVIHKLTQYESLMWVDKYDEPGSFEIYAPPLDDIKAAAQVNNYFMSDKSEHLMIVEKLETTVSPSDGTRLIISGRSLESILERRVLFLKCYFRDRNSSSTPSPGTAIGADNLEDAIRQLLEYLFINPVHWDNTQQTWVPATDRIIPNFIFEYSGHDVALTDALGRAIVDNNNQPIMADNLDPDAINSIVLKDCEFEKGENALNIVNTIVKQAHLGYKITLDANHNFVFRLIKGKDLTTGQYNNPAVIFSPRFNNLKSSKHTDDHGENFRNFVYTEGETYKKNAPTIIETGDATGLLRREVYVTSEVQHETESTIVTHESGIVKQKKKLTESEYQTALSEDAEKYYKKYAAKTTMESEIEPRLTFIYGRDFGIGDIVEVQDGTGNTGKVRCIEFIISHSSSGYEEYPTFETVEEDEESPAQTSSSGGEFTDEGGNKKTSYETMSSAEMVAGTETEQRLMTADQTKAGVESIVSDKIRSLLLEMCYPVGSFYISTKNVSPQTFLGGTWASRSGYMLRGATSGVTFNSDTSDGGSDNAIVVSHDHTFTGTAVNSGTISANHSHSYTGPTARTGWDPKVSGSNNNHWWGSSSVSTGTVSANHTHSVTAKGTVGSKGSSGTGKNLPKYKNVYIWERTA